MISSEQDELFNAINNEISWLHTVWELFIQIYGSKDEYHETMSSSAPFFFHMLHEMLFDELALSFSRLTDAPVTSRQSNASMEALIQSIDVAAHPKLVADLTTQLKELKKNYPEFRTWRHKRVSHNDLMTSIPSSSVTMPQLTRGKVEAALKDVRTWINEFSLWAFQKDISYHPFLLNVGDGHELMRFLGRGVALPDEGEA